jgi:hypothetical protein
MTARQLKDALRRLGVTQVGLAHALAVDPRTVRRWTADELPVPRTVELVLACWRDHGMVSNRRRA